jgi:hypothetical protein
MKHTGNVTVSFSHNLNAFLVIFLLLMWIKGG